MGAYEMEKSHWLQCPVCKMKTKIKIYNDTVLLNFPLWCPTCKEEHLIDVVQLKMIYYESKNK